MTLEPVATESMVKAEANISGGWSFSSLVVITTSKIEIDEEKVALNATGTFTHPTLGTSVVSLIPPQSTVMNNEEDDVLRKGDEATDQYNNKVYVDSGQSIVESDIK